MRCHVCDESVPIEDLVIVNTNHTAPRAYCGVAHMRIDAYQLADDVLTRQYSFINSLKRAARNLVKGLGFN